MRGKEWEDAKQSLKSRSFTRGGLLRTQEFFRKDAGRSYSSGESRKKIKERTSILPHLSSVQLLSHVPLFMTPRTAARQASLSITSSWSLPKLMSIESVMPSNHLILCCPLLLLPHLGFHLFARPAHRTQGNISLTRLPVYYKKM